MKGKRISNNKLKEIRLVYIKLRSTRKLAEHFGMSKTWGGYVKAKYFPNLKVK